MKELLDYLQRVTFGFLPQNCGKVSKPSRPAWAELTYYTKQTVDIYVEDSFITSVTSSAVHIYFFGDVRNRPDDVYADHTLRAIPVRVARQLQKACTREPAVQLKVGGLPVLIGTLYRYGRFFEKPRRDRDQEPLADMSFSAIWEELQDPKLRDLFAKGLCELTKRKRRKPSERIA